MPLKNIDKADPKLIEYWYMIADHGQTTVAFPDKKSATNIRSQMSTYRSLAAHQGPTMYEMTKDYILTVSSVAVNQWVIFGTKPVPISITPSKPLPSHYYNPQEHHHNPIGLSPTGIPMQMPEVLSQAEMPQPLTQEEMKQMEREADRQRNINLLKKLGFDKPPTMNPLSEEE
jgi:hypothetical protein